MNAELPLDLPEVAPAEPKPRVKVKPAPPLVAEADWSVIDHVCGECFGRLLGRMRDGKRFYRCAGCGRHTPDGAEPIAKTPGPNGRWTPAICACQMRFGIRDAGLRCVLNDRQSMSSPTEIVARQVL